MKLSSRPRCVRQRRGKQGQSCPQSMYASSPAYHACELAATRLERLSLRTHYLQYGQFGLYEPLIQRVQPIEQYRNLADDRRIILTSKVDQKKKNRRRPGGRSDFYTSGASLLSFVCRERQDQISLLQQLAVLEIWLYIPPYDLKLKSTQPRPASPVDVICIKSIFC